MSDVLSASQRSFCMSKIRGKNTKPEVVLRSCLWRKRLRFRIHYPLIGKPDVVFTKQRIAIFVDGCFWHSCPEHGVMPKTNASFWDAKLSKNRERDVKVTTSLQHEGWDVMRFWEHEIDDNVERVAGLIAAKVSRRLD